MPLRLFNVSYINSSLPIGIYKVVAWTNSSINALTFYLTVSTPIMEANHSLTYLALLGAGNYSYQGYQPPTQNWTGELIRFSQTIEKHPISVEILIDNSTSKNSSIYGTPLSIEALSTNISSITLNESLHPSNYNLFTLTPKYATLTINGTKIANPSYNYILGAGFYNISAVGESNANFSISYFAIKNITKYSALNITKYPFVNLTLSIDDAEPISYNEPIQFRCNYTTNLTTPVNDVFNKQILDSIVNVSVNSTNYSALYNSTLNLYTNTQRYNVSEITAYCYGENKNFSSAKSSSIKYYLYTPAPTDYTINKSVLPYHNITSSIYVNSYGLRYIQPYFVCNGVQRPVAEVGLNIFRSTFNASPGQYDCIWTVESAYNVNRSEFNESAVAEINIAKLGQINISSIYLSNVSLNAYYRNYISFTDPANISWAYNYSYTYPNSLAPPPTSIVVSNLTKASNYSYLRIPHGVSLLVNVSPDSSQNYSLTYVYVNGTKISIYPRENLSYNNTFGNSIAEYVDSLIYPAVPNGTRIDIKNSCQYLANITGKGNIKGTDCHSYNLTESNGIAIANITYSWIRYNGTAISYRNVTLTRDVLNQSLQGYEMYNISNFQYIPISGLLLAKSYAPDGWNETSSVYLIKPNTTQAENVSAVGIGTRIYSQSLAYYPTVSYTTFSIKWGVAIPNTTRAWIINSPMIISLYPPSYKYFILRNSTTVLFNSLPIFSNSYSNVLSFAGSVINSPSPMSFTAYVNSSVLHASHPSDVITILYNVPQNFISAPSLSLSAPLLKQFHPSSYIGYIILFIAVVSLISLVDIKYRKQFENFINKLNRR